MFKIRMEYMGFKTDNTGSDLQKAFINSKEPGLAHTYIAYSCSPSSLSQVQQRNKVWKKFGSFWEKYKGSF